MNRIYEGFSSMTALRSLKTAVKLWNYVQHHDSGHGYGIYSCSSLVTQSLTYSFTHTLTHTHRPFNCENALLQLIWTSCFSVLSGLWVYIDWDGCEYQVLTCEFVPNYLKWFRDAATCQPVKQLCTSLCKSGEEEKWLAKEIVGQPGFLALIFIFPLPTSCFNIITLFPSFSLLSQYQQLLNSKL